jgi:predicted dehydrogenase
VIVRRLAVVGCGAVLEGVHERPLRELERKRHLQVVALVDIDAESLERAAASFPGASRGAALETATAAGADSLLVLSPPHTHAEVVVSAIRAGLDVLCEKPLTDSASGLDHIASVLDVTQRARVAMIRRQFDTHDILRRYMGELIDLTDFRITYREGAPFTWPMKSTAPFFRGPGEAGLLIDVGSHVVDLMLWLFGQRVAVSSYRDNATDRFAETDAELRLSLEGGEAFVQLSRRQPLAEGWLTESKLGQVWVPLGPESIVFTRPPAARQWRRLSPAGSAWRSLLQRRGRRPCASYDQAAYRQLDQFLFGDAVVNARRTRERPLGSAARSAGTASRRRRIRSTSTATPPASSVSNRART